MKFGIGKQLNTKHIGSTNLLTSIRGTVLIGYDNTVYEVDEHRVRYRTIADSSYY